MEKLNYKNKNTEKKYLQNYAKEHIFRSKEESFRIKKRFYRIERQRIKRQIRRN